MYNVHNVSISRETFAVYNIYITTVEPLEKFPGVPETRFTRKRENIKSNDDDDDNSRSWLCTVFVYLHAFIERDGR